jgi:hypothetical protein
LLQREARIYVCRVDEGTVGELAVVPDFYGIPTGEEVWTVG